ncbi:hypothetical protein WDL1CHR_00799 [Variovorax sp. WDL1]|nr:hypothetical protein CHC07_02826 [Variovorax sp. B4]PNG57832.1 hypothetical protein CHC06_02828 [Variovorax sp. B2]VTV09725.1 hypothetical protein WDL1CHR_00799 [Variovorax sp. WDL1]
MTTLAQELFYQNVRYYWRAAMNECVCEFRRICVMR